MRFSCASRPVFATQSAGFMTSHLVVDDPTAFAGGSDSFALFHSLSGEQASCSFVCRGSPCTGFGLDVRRETVQGAEAVAVARARVNSWPRQSRTPKPNPAPPPTAADGGPALGLPQQSRTGFVVFLRRRQHLDAGFKLRSEEHTSELQSRGHLVCRLLL